jgi:hypothetical protein
VNYVSFYDALRFANWMNRSRQRRKAEPPCWAARRIDNGATVTLQVVIVLPARTGGTTAYYNASAAAISTIRQLPLRRLFGAGTTPNSN